MDYSLLLLLLLLSPNYAEDAPAQRRNLKDSFAVNIGAGYGVGIDHSFNNLPRSTTRINGPRTLQFTREPRTLKRFIPQPNNMMHQLSTPENGNFINPNFEHHPPAHSSFNGKSYGDREEDKDVPSMSDVQNVLNGVNKPYSKILQVIKVPAIYEIHLQSDHEKGHQGSFSKLKLAEDEHLYLENKPAITRTKLSESEYKEWLNNYYKNREDSFGLGMFSSLSKLPTPITGNLNEINGVGGKMRGDEILPPILNHHYNTFDNKFDNRVVNYKHTWQDNQFESKFHPESKRDVVLNSIHPNTKPTFPINKKVLDRNLPLQKPGPFIHNQEISESDQPQALHEVPAPYLGKVPTSKQFDLQSFATPATTLNIEVNHKFNDLHPKPTASNIHSVKSNFQDIYKPEVVPSSEQFASHIKSNQNLIYGKPTGPVLSPYDSNGPHSFRREEAPRPIYTQPVRTEYIKISEPNTKVVNHENSPSHDAHIPIEQKADKNVYPDKTVSNEETTDMDIGRSQLWEPKSVQALTGTRVTETSGRRISENDKMFRKNSFLNPYPKKKPYGRKGRLDYIIYITKKSTEDK